MSVSRDLTLRIVTPYESCVTFLSEFTENDRDSYDHINFHNQDEALNILLKREEKGWDNFLTLNTLVDGL